MNHPTREECLRLLQEYGTPAHVQGHCMAVARVAYALGDALNRHGFSFDLELIRAAGMLHDIARTEERHWDVGADLMERLGYCEEADIIRVHMTYSPFSPLEEATETDLVCLGDRTVKEDRYVGLEERIDYIVQKAARGGHPEAEPIIREKMKEIRHFIGEIEDVIGMTMDELMESTADEDR